MLNALLFLSLYLWTSPVLAQTRLQIIIQPIPFFADSESSGTFIELSKEIARQLKIDIDIQSYPALRAIDYFNKNQNVVLLPGSQWKLEGHEYYESEPIYTKKVFIYSRSPQNFTSIQNLANKRVGITLGYSYPPELRQVPGIEIQVAPTDESNLKKLRANRIDVFLGEEYSAKFTMEKLNLKDIHFNKNQPLSAQPIFYAFQKTPQGLVWRQKFDTVIKSLKKSGQLDKIVLNR